MFLLADLAPSPGCHRHLKPHVPQTEGWNPPLHTQYLLCGAYLSEGQRIPVRSNPGVLAPLSPPNSTSSLSAIPLGFSSS